MVVDLRSGVAMQASAHQQPPTPAAAVGVEVAIEALGAAGASADGHDGYLEAQRSQAAAAPALKTQDAAAAEEAALEAALLGASRAGAPEAEEAALAAALLGTSRAGAPESAKLPPDFPPPPGDEGSGDKSGGMSGAVPEREPEKEKEKKPRRRGCAVKDAVIEGGVAKEKSEKKERAPGRRGRGNAVNADRSKAAGSGGTGAAGLAEAAAACVASPDGDVLPASATAADATPVLSEPLRTAGVAPAVSGEADAQSLQEGGTGEEGGPERKAEG